MNKYINLVVHSYYSFLQSSLSPKQIVDFAIQNKCDYASLIDINVMYGAMEFYKLCLQNNIKPIIGIQVNHLDSKLVLVAKNYFGYKKLLKISSCLMTDTQKDWQEYLDENLFIIKLTGTFVYNGPNFYTTNPNDENCIACEEVFYYDEDDQKTFCILQAIRHERVLQIQNLNHLDSANKLLTPNEIASKYNNHQLENLNKIVTSIDLQIPSSNTNNIIKFSNDLNLSSQQYLDLIVNEKLHQYLANNPNLDRNIYLERLNFELQIIHNKNFDDYFLVVQDFINWAKQNKIMVGPGRGSAAGSLVSFCLNITEIDPIKYNLLFERFLNIERVSMPDIDTDVMDSKRELVINYLFNKYGYNHVCHIITFAKMKAKQAIRDVGRVLNINLNIINKICKNIKAEFENDLINAISNPSLYPKSEKSLKVLQEEFIHNKELFHFSQKLIGVPRQSGTHAAGVILSNEKITNYSAVQSCLDNKIMCQTSMEYLEELGLIKIDILGLRNLTIIDNILKLVKHTKKITLDLKTINLSDSKVYEIFKSGNTNGIFQFESDGMKKVLKSINPVSLQDLALASSIYRPGASDGIKLYLQNKANKNNLTFINDQIKQVLQPTYGVIVYQEQIIKLVQIIGNFDKFKADNFRKAISKKKEDLVLSLKQEFISGALKNGYSQDEAQKEFDYILKFASYGFNYSHALCYALISYWLAYLKTYYPLESMSIFLTYSDMDNEKLMCYINEAKAMNILIAPPNINLSTTSFVLLQNKIIFSFMCIPSLGIEMAKKIIELRSQQPNQNFVDANKTIAKLSNSGISKTVLINLVKIGAFDELNKNRDYLLANIDILCDKKNNVLDKNNNFIFDLNLNKDIAYNNQNYAEYEQEVIGINFSESYLDKLFKQYKNEYKLFHLDNEHDNLHAVIKITAINSAKTKTQKPYLIVDFVESNHNYTAMAFDNVINLQEKLVIGNYYIVRLRKSNSTKNYNIIELIKKVD